MKVARKDRRIKVFLMIVSGWRNPQVQKTPGRNCAERKPGELRMKGARTKGVSIAQDPIGGTEKGFRLVSPKFSWIQMIQRFL